MSDEPRIDIDVDTSDAEQTIAALRAELAEYRAYRTLGGPPHPPDQEWRNRNVGPPDSATTGPETVT